MAHARAQLFACGIAPNVDKIITIIIKMYENFIIAWYQFG